MHTQLTYVCSMTRATQTEMSTDEAKELLRDAHDADFAYSDITHDDVVEALRTLADSDDIHEFWGLALEVPAAQTDAVTKVFEVQIGDGGRADRPAHVDVYHLRMGDGRIYQMGHLWGPDTHERGLTDYPNAAVREDIMTIHGRVAEKQIDEPDVDVKQNDIDVDVPRF